MFASLLDERQRRLFAGLEALKCDGAVTGASRDCSASTRRRSSGRRQLVERDVEVDRVCARAADAHQRKKNVPEVIACIQALMEHETAGDPVRGLKWTRRTTAKVADEL